VLERQWGDDRFTIPKPIRHELGRPNLLHRLTDSSQSGLVLVLAPSGYGKTTLLAQLARHSPTSVMWLSLWEGCADPATLTEALFACLETLPWVADGSGIRRSSEGLLDWRTFVETLNGSPRAVTIILDGIEHLSEESGALIVRWLDHLRDGHRLILAGYVAQHLKLYRYLSSGAALVFGPDDLAFTVEETRSLFHVRNVALDPSVTQRQVSGWPVAVGLLASGNLHGFSPEGLIEDTLETLPLELRRRLPLAAIASTWSDADLATLGIDMPAGWLELLRFSGLPVTPLGAQRFRPHDLLRRVLLERLEGSHESVDAIRQRAASVALERGDALEAAQIYRQLGHAAQALQVIQASLERAWAQAEFSTLRRLLEPFEQAQLTPRYAAMLAVAWLETGRAKEGNPLLDQLPAQGETRSVVLYGLVRRCMRLGDVSGQSKLCQQALEGELSAAERARFERMRANALHNLDDFQGAVDICERLVLEAERDGRRMDLGNALFVLQAALLNLHRWHDCENALLRGIQVFEQLDLPTRLLPLLVDLAELYRVTGKAIQAVSALERAQPLAEREESEMLPIILESRGDLALMAGRLESAQSFFEKALERCEAYQYDRVATRIRLRLSEVLARRGLFEQSTAVFQFAQRASFTRPEWLQVAEAYHRGVIAWCQDDLETAENAFGRVEGVSSDPFHYPRAAAWSCYIAHRTGRLTEETVQTLKERCRHFDWAQIAAPDEAVFEPMILEARQRNWWFKTPPQTFISKQSLLTPTLRLTTLGKLELHVNEVIVRVPLTKSFEILSFLALEGPTRRETIVDALWDGSSDQRHVDYFKVALRRLRVVLSEALQVSWNAVPVIDKRFRIDPRLTVEVDALTLRALEPNDLSGMQANLERYGGEFLPFSESTWASERRQGFLRDAVNLAVYIADLLAQTRHSDSLLYFRRAVQLEPLHVTAHRRLIQQLLLFGQPHQALRVWQDLSVVCREELNEPLDFALEAAIHEQLRRGSLNA
jgi:LuxR family transcriptional regulator, maltose regulon positive regulatory protein